MPGSRKYSKKNKMVRRARMGRRRPVRLNVNRALQPISQRYICKMKYADNVTTTAGGYFGLNLNSVWDPNRTGGGHQPYGFDQLAVLYNRYRVISCGYRIQIGLPSTYAVGVQVGSLPANETVILSGTPAFAELRENPRAKYVMVNPGAPATVLKGKVYLPSLMGRTKAQYMADDRYQALVTTSPLEAGILNIFTAGANDVPLEGLNVSILLEYTVEFFDINKLAQSTV